MNDITIKEKKDTTVLLKSDAYNLVVNKQTEILNIINKRISIQDLVHDSTIIGLDKLDINKYRD